MCKNILKSLCLILCVVITLISFNGCINISDKEIFIKSDNPIFVKTISTDDTDISYFELNGNGDFRICNEFEPNVNEYYITDYNIGDYFLNPKLKKVKIPENIKKALSATENFEGAKEHDTRVERVFVRGDICYISLSYNVNWQQPYSLLEYDVKKDSLKEIMYISNEQIIGIKI